MMCGKRTPEENKQMTSIKIYLSKLFILRITNIYLLLKKKYILSTEKTAFFKKNKEKFFYL
jgi:hypothetical protein